MGGCVNVWMLISDKRLNQSNFTILLLISGVRPAPINTSLQSIANKCEKKIREIFQCNFLVFHFFPGIKSMSMNTSKSAFFFERVFSIFFAINVHYCCKCYSEFYERKFDWNTFVFFNNLRKMLLGSD